MSDLNPYIFSLYVGSTPAVELAAEYLRKQEILPVLAARIAEIGSNYGVENLIDPAAVSEELFEEMVSNAVFETDEPRFAGKYYRYSEAHWKAMRSSFRQNDGITVTATRIGSRFYPDVFEGFKSGILEATDGAMAIPAADRIVRLDDNQPEVVEFRHQATELVRALQTDNDVGELNVEQVEAALAEAQNIENALKRSLIRPDVIAEYSFRVLHWIGEKAAGAAVGKIAWGLLVLLAAFFGFTV
ncbi:MAG: hypothetical protein M3R64_00745 [Pseudomonadota bacterium]|nr:hypothetical protein [Pseudomonadota bacterium]